MMFVLLVSGTTHFCIKQTIKCWELQLPPEASEYYIDILALNSIVSLIDPFTHSIWHIYWLIVVFAVSILGKWIWGKLDP